MKTKMKVVINTHPTYRHVLDVLLTSLDYKNHIDKLFVSVSDVVDEKQEEVRAEYARAYGLHPNQILTTSLNIDEYSMFVSLSKHLEECSNSDAIVEDELFLMLHDTCEAGRLFWPLLEKTERIIRDASARDKVPKLSNPAGDNILWTIDKEAAPVTTIVHRQNIRDATALFFRVFALEKDDGTLATLCSYPDGENNEKSTFYGYLSYDGDVTADRSRALPVTMPVSPEERDQPVPVAAAVASSLQESYMNYLWWPVSANFNLGIATASFISRVGKAFADIKSLTKVEGIDIEISENNPRNLRRIATYDGVAHWRFVYGSVGDVRQCKFPTMSLWLNDTDVYGNGKLRNVAYLHTLDLKKYSCLVGERWNAVHDART